MKRTLIWLLDNAAFAALLWFGFELNNSGAHNVAVFLIYFKFIGSFVAYSDAVKQSYIAKGKHPVSTWLNELIEGAVVAFLAWHGEYWYATMFLIHAINMGMLPLAIKRHQEAAP